MFWAPGPKPECAPQRSAPKHTSQLPPKGRTPQNEILRLRTTGHTANIALAPGLKTIGCADADRDDVRHSDPGYIATPSATKVANVVPRNAHVKRNTNPATHGHCRDKPLVRDAGLPWLAQPPYGCPDRAIQAVAAARTVTLG